MRIGVDIRTLMDKEPSGVSEHTLNLITEIINQDTENEYILFYNSFRDISERIPRFKRKNVKIIKTSYPNKLFNLVMQLGLRWPKLDKLLDVETFLMPNPGFFALSRKCKKILVIHDLSFLRDREFFNYKRLLWHWIINVKKQIENANKIIAVSENTKNDIIELCGVNKNKIEIIYPGIGDSFKVLEKNNRETGVVKEKYNLPNNFLLYLGTIEPRKNIIGIIKAYEKFRESNQHLDGINKKFNDHKLVVAGAKGWRYKEIYNEWGKSKYKHDIKFIGYVEKSVKVHLYNLASIFLYISFLEGFGFPPLEAMGSGTPVIASNTSSLGEVIGDAGLLVNPYKIEEIAKSIEILINNNDLRKQLIKKGLVNADKYKWEKTAGQYINILKNK